MVELHDQHWICYGGVYQVNSNHRSQFFFYLPFDRGAKPLEYCASLPNISEEISLDRSHDAKLN